MDKLGIIVQKLKADALNYHNLKSALVEHIGNRGQILKNETSATEYDYCELVGRIKELNEFVEFLLKAGIFTTEEKQETNEINETNETKKEN